MRSEDLFVNYELIDRVRKAREIELLNGTLDWEYDNEWLEGWNLTAAFKKYCNMDENELAVAVLAALYKHPLVVMQVITEYLTELRRGKGRKHEANKRI